MPIAKRDEIARMVAVPRGDGPGEQEHLFDRFFRTQAAEQNAIRGIGLGLAISQAIAQAHGGLIEVKSEENTGTTFRLVFPANT